MATANYERLGSFYLGRRFDPARNTDADELILHDARDLTTLAVCVSMMVSGKTGLGLALLEEAAIDGIPDYLYRSATPPWVQCAALKRIAAPGTSEGDFRAQLTVSLRETRDSQIEQSDTVVSKGCYGYRCRYLYNRPTSPAIVLPMPSFDIVSELDEHEITNAVDQANRELGNRFDFKGTGARFEQAAAMITLIAPSDFQLKQMMDIFKLKLTKRGIDLACMKIEEPVVNIQTAKQVVTLREGIEADLGKKIQRLIKDSKVKVQAAIQDQQMRVTGKNRDDLQEVIALVRGGKLDMPLQFKNFRD